MPNGPIVVIAGTNRPNANALKIARIVESHYIAMKVPVELYSLSQMPAEIFNPASYATKPPAFTAVQDLIVASRGLHVVSPEYNGGFPGVLKYFIDMLKFPDSFEHKPVAFTGEAAGIWGAIRPIEQLQQIFGYRNAYVFPDRVFIPGINGKLDANGQLTDPAIADRLQKQATGFAAFTERFL
jgi:chromate reductase, NAD(P)H dehydrogenase (quinone)